MPSPCLKHAKGISFKFMKEISREGPGDIELRVHTTMPSMKKSPGRNPAQLMMNHDSIRNRPTITDSV